MIFLLAGLIGLITAVIVYTRWNYGKLESIGIPVVEPSFCFGSQMDMHKVVCHEDDMKNVKKYGKIYGSYEGRSHHVYIADPELIKMIFIKDFDYFHSKRQFDLGHPLINEMIDILPLEKWRVIRNSLTPTLTTGKIRNMSNQMLDAIAECMKYLDETVKPSKVYESRKLFIGVATDIIARCAFGQKINAIRDPENEFVKQLNKLALIDFDPNFVLSLSNVFPILFKFIPIFDPKTLDFFGNVVRSIIKERKQNNEKNNDFVDCLVEMTENCEKDEEYKKLGIKVDTVLAQALFFIFAGFETSTTTMTHMSFYLSNNPDKQKRLQEEVDAVVAKHNGKINHDSIHDLVYLTACIHETLRMSTPLIRLERMCQKEWTTNYNGKQITIQPGTTIQIPCWSIHYNEEYYPDPYEFKPERFLPENKENMNQYAFLAFGQGPHNCIGMRFAMENIKLTMCNIMKEFSFESNEESTKKLVYKPGRNFLIVNEPVKVNIVRRISNGMLSYHLSNNLNKHDKYIFPLFTFILASN